MVWAADEARQPGDLVPQAHSRLYDSYALFDTMTDSSAGQGEPRSGGTRPGVALPSSCENAQTAVDGA